MSCQGCVLLVDAMQGIQAQTISNYELAFFQNLAIIPVINKVDVENVDVQQVQDEIEMSFGLEREEVLGVSAKTGLNVQQVLDRIIESIPSAQGLAEDVDYESALKGYLVDSWFI